MVLAAVEQQWDEALARYRALVGAPMTAPDHYQRGTQRNLQGLYADALRDFAWAQALGLQTPELHHNWGIALFHLQQPLEALKRVEHALARATGPALATMYNTRGFILQSLGRLPEALSCYDQAIALQPDLAQAQFNRGITQLALGMWEAGWQGYEWRWTGATEAQRGWMTRPTSTRPQWRGKTPATTDSILVFAEQGLGDVLQFSRYLPLLALRFARVSLVCPPPLLRLLQHAFGAAVECLAEVPQNQDAWQWQCPLLSLPLAFATRVDTVPASPYLTPLPELTEKWYRRLSDMACTGPKIGLCWAGAAALKDDAQRSMPLHVLEPVLQCGGVVWVSLQKGDAAAQLTGRAGISAVHDWSSELQDFADTAALVAQLDLVITVDTAVAHLAGALGKPVWLLNRLHGDWRWLHNRSDTPWYSTMRLFSQSSAGDWSAPVRSVVACIEGALRDNPPSFLKADTACAY